jgi:hypothetical protein
MRSELCERVVFEAVDDDRTSDGDEGESYNAGEIG